LTWLLALGTYIDDDAVWKAKAMDNVIEQLSCLHCSSLYEGLVFDPFREFVDADVDLAEAPWS
jgi:hypothetical protein